ncbi:MAG: indolepyruvate oxidoreductase subunit beta [Planctomycetota bacterium]|nr:indolepyruvate oxidoreductase subunit beta [Planctomycetota bacterium]
MNNNTCNILFCGIGGQGVLKASEICGWAAIFDGFHVKKSEVHGMAQRGGSVESHLRFGKKVFSPLITRGQVDYLVSFHHDEHDRMKNLLRHDGVDLIEYLDKAQAQIEDQRQMNTFLVGVLSALLPVKEQSWIKAIEKVFPEKILAQNKEVFLKGRRMIKV